MIVSIVTFRLPQRWTVEQAGAMRTLASLIAVLLLAAAVPAWAQKRVAFEPGRSSAIIKGKTTGGPSEGGGMDPATYVLRARAGQQMLVHLTSPKNTAIFTIYAPGMESMRDAVNRGEWVGQLPKNGDYQIIVFPRDNGPDTAFTMEVSVRAAPKQSRDAELIELLKKEGSNVSKPHEVEFMLVFQSRANADRAAAKIRPDGFKVRVQQIDRTANWWLFAARTMSLKEEELARYRQRFREIAAANDGEYDDWSAPVVK